MRRATLAGVLLAASLVVAVIGLRRAPSAAWLPQGMPTLAGVLYALALVRSRNVAPEVLPRVGGTPLAAAGGLAAASVCSGILEGLWRGGGHPLALTAGLLAALGLASTAVVALRLSTASVSKRPLYALAGLALTGAAVATVLLARQLPRYPLL